MAEGSEERSLLTERFWMLLQMAGEENITGDCSAVSMDMYVVISNKEIGIIL